MIVTPSLDYRVYLQTKGIYLFYTFADHYCGLDICLNKGWIRKIGGDGGLLSIINSEYLDFTHGTVSKYPNNYCVKTGTYSIPNMVPLDLPYQDTARLGNIKYWSKKRQLANIYLGEYYGLMGSEQTALEYLDWIHKDKPVGPWQTRISLLRVKDLPPENANLAYNYGTWFTVGYEGENFMLYYRGSHSSRDEPHSYVDALLVIFNMDLYNNNVRLGILYYNIPKSKPINNKDYRRFKEGVA